MSVSCWTSVYDLRAEENGAREKKDEEGGALYHIHPTGASKTGTADTTLTTPQRRSIEVSTTTRGAAPLLETSLRL